MSPSVGVRVRYGLNDLSVCIPLVRIGVCDSVLNGFGGSGGSGGIPFVRVGIGNSLGCVSFV